MTWDLDYLLSLVQQRNWVLTQSLRISLDIDLKNNLKILNFSRLFVFCKKKKKYIVIFQVIISNLQSKIKNVHILYIILYSRNNYLKVNPDRYYFYLLIKALIVWKAKFSHLPGNDNCWWLIQSSTRLLA